MSDNDGTVAQEANKVQTIAKQMSPMRRGLVVDGFFLGNVIMVVILLLTAPNCTRGMRVARRTVSVAGPED